jgi:hypothetical protein
MSGMRPQLHPNVDGIDVTLADGAIVLHMNGTIDAPAPFPGQMPFAANVEIRPFISRGREVRAGWTRTGAIAYASIKPNVRVYGPWYIQAVALIGDFLGFDVFEKLRRVNKTDMAALFRASVDNQPCRMSRMCSRRLRDDSS